MRLESLGPLFALGSLPAIAATIVLVVPAEAQIRNVVNTLSSTKPWTPPRTPDGQPDLQGVWTNATLTPFERPPELTGKVTITEQEAAALEKKASENRVDRPPKPGDPGSYNQAWSDGGTTWLSTRQSSLVVDPPNGRVSEPPETAINSVRHARPGSIENSAQENYVRRCQPVVAEERHERALACLLGGALGDAFGYTVEFSSVADIRRRFGPRGISDAVLLDGKFLVSDDTQMTLSTLEGLLHTLEGSSTPALESIRMSYMEWLQTQRGNQRSKVAPQCGWLMRQSVMHADRAPGNTCLSALLAGGRGTIGNPINDSKGCGGVMRVAPIGLVKQFPAEEAFRLAAEVAALTHGHVSGYLSAGMMAAILRHLMDVKDVHGAIESSLAILATYRGHEETTAAVRNALTAVRVKSENHPAAIQALGGGWVGEEALAIAIYSVLSADTFLDAVRIASNHSGDSDSTASIAGQLWGAAEGLTCMPHRWVTALDVRIPVLHLARQLMPFV